MLGVRTHGLVSAAVWRLEIIIIASGNFDLTPQGTGIRDQLHLTVHSWLVINIRSGRSMSGTRYATPD